MEIARTISVHGPQGHPLRAERPRGAHGRSEQRRSIALSTRFCGGSRSSSSSSGILGRGFGGGIGGGGLGIEVDRRVAEARNGRICLIRSLVVRRLLTGGTEKGLSFSYSPSMRGRRPRRECQFESGLVLHRKRSPAKCFCLAGLLRLHVPGDLPSWLEPPSPLVK